MLQCMMSKSLVCLSYPLDPGGHIYVLKLHLAKLVEEAEKIVDMLTALLPDQLTQYGAWSFDF